MKLISFKKLILMFFFTGSLLLLNCLKNPAAVNQTLGGTNIFFSISEGFMPGKDAPVPQIRFRSARIYSCCNFMIATSIRKLDNTIHIDFHGISDPGICLTALGPARYQEFLPLQNGSYTLFLRNGPLIDKYKLILNEKSIVISELQPPMFSSVEDANYWRYPVNSFVYLCGTLTKDSWFYTNILDSLKSLDGLQEFTFENSGRSPYPDSSSGYQRNYPARYFYYRNEADFLNVVSLLERYSAATMPTADGWGIRLSKWTGESCFFP